MSYSYKKVLLAVMLAAAFIIVVPAASATLLDDLFGPFSGVDFGAAYARYSLFIDGILYFLIFFGLSKFVFKDKFGKGANPLIIGVSLSLSFAAAYFGSQVLNFRLGMLGPYALIIVFLFMFYTVFAVLKNLGASKFLAFSVAFLLLWYLVTGFLSQWFDLLGNPVLKSVLYIGYIVSVIGVLIGAFSLFKGIKAGDNVFSRNDSAKLADKEDAIAKQQDKDIKKSRQESAKLLRTVGDMENGIKKLEEVFETINKRHQDTSLMEMNDSKEVQAIIEQMIQETNTIAPVVDTIKKAKDDLAGGKVPEEQIEQLTEYVRRAEDWLEKAFAILPGQVEQVHKRVTELQRSSIEEDELIKEARKDMHEEMNKIKKIFNELGVEGKWASAFANAWRLFSEFFSITLEKAFEKFGLLLDKRSIEEVWNYSQKVKNEENFFKGLRKQLIEESKKILAEGNQILNIYMADYENLKAQKRNLEKTESKVVLMTKQLNDIIKDATKKKVERLKKHLEDLHQKSNYEALKLTKTEAFRNKIMGFGKIAVEMNRLIKIVLKEEQEFQKTLLRWERYNQINRQNANKFLDNLKKVNKKEKSAERHILEDVAVGKYKFPS